MCKYLSLVPSGFELMVIAGYEEVNLIGVNTQGPYLANLYNNPYTALGHATRFEVLPSLHLWYPSLYAFLLDTMLSVKGTFLDSRYWDMGFLQSQLPNWSRHSTESVLSESESWQESKDSQRTKYEQNQKIPQPTSAQCYGQSDDLWVQSLHVHPLDPVQLLQSQRRMTSESFMCRYAIYSCANMYWP